MDSPRDNTLMYRQDPNDQTRARDESQVFVATVFSVDYERKVCTLEDSRTGLVYSEVSVIPANASSFEGTDVQMPEVGTLCIAAPIFYMSGFRQIAIVAYVVSETNRAQDSIAIRGPEGVGGYQDRKRGIYRKTYPGQKAATYTSGYSEKIDAGWDRSSRDLSRDRLDADRRSWTQITGRKVTYTDAGLSFQGAVNRPDASEDDVTPRVLPDGSKEYIVYLKPKADLTDRYLKDDTQDILPFAEHTERIQEFSLDYPLPAEILETDLFDKVLGTTADPYKRTEIKKVGNLSFDDETFAINQDPDHPTSRTLQPVGPTTKEGKTPSRRAFVYERTVGTLVGFNRFDKAHYGKVLKPVLFPDTKEGRFGADVESGYNPVKDSEDHVEARLAASTLALRFPHEYNTTRLDVTKEGLTLFEIGATLTKDEIQKHWQKSGGYEHPHGAGRSMEGHLVGSLKLVIGKNHDEEEAIDLQALGQIVLRVGADDATLPNAGRSVLTQIRGQNDAVAERKLQYWTEPKNKLGDAGSLDNKTGFERVSLRGAFDGGTILRMGARDPQAKRKHLINGYSDPKGEKEDNSKNSHTVGRPAYPSGDDQYQFHDLTKAGTPQVNFPPYQWSGQPVDDMDRHGLSLDVHAVRDILLRMGRNPDSGQSLLMDLAGGLVAALGKDKKGRSVTAALDGGAELTIGPNDKGAGLNLEITGDVNWTVKGNFHLNVTGDMVMESTTFRQVAKTDAIVTAQKIIHSALARHTIESPEILHHEGNYQDYFDENDLPVG
jgi:hypothetical protein